MAGVERDDYEDSPLDEDLIPGDNDKPGPGQEIVPPYNPDAPDNLTRIPESGGDIPIVTPVRP